MGKHPKYGVDILVTFGKYGPMLKMCINKKKCLFAPIRTPLTMENITLQDAIELFEYPRELGDYEGKPIKLNRGKYGFYLSFGDKKFSLTNNQDEKEEKEYEEEGDITYEDAVRIIEKQKKDILWEGQEGKLKYEVKEGPYGKYIKVTDKGTKKLKKSFNVKLPGNINPQQLNLEKIKEFVKNRKSPYKKSIYK